MARFFLGDFSHMNKRHIITGVCFSFSVYQGKAGNYLVRLAAEQPEHMYRIVFIVWLTKYHVIHHHRRINADYYVLIGNIRIFIHIPSLFQSKHYALLFRRNIAFEFCLFFNETAFIKFRRSYFENSTYV